MAQTAIPHPLAIIWVGANYLLYISMGFWAMISLFDHSLLMFMLFSLTYWPTLMSFIPRYIHATRRIAL
jgi:hypothetical protein